MMVLQVMRDLVSILEVPANVLPGKILTDVLQYVSADISVY